MHCREHVLATDVGEIRVKAVAGKEGDIDIQLIITNGKEEIEVYLSELLAQTITFAIMDLIQHEE